MKRQSYKIKHDFLFVDEDTEIVIPQYDSNLSSKSELKLSDVLKAKDDESLYSLLDCNTPNIVIVDDIGPCINPASERYKQFIIRCVYRKLIKRNVNVYL